MTSQHQETPQSGQGKQPGEHAKNARNLLKDVCLTDSATVREPAQLAKRLFGVSRAVGDIVQVNAVNSHENRIMNVSTKAVQPSRVELLLGAIRGSMSKQPTAITAFTAAADARGGATLSLRECRDQGVRTIWNLTQEVVIPSDELIVNKLYSEPAILHDTQEVYAHTMVQGKELAMYPFYSPEYQPGVTAAYLGVLQSLCRQLLNITTQKP